MLPRGKGALQWRPKDSAVFIREGWLVIDEHPDGRFCKLAKVIKHEREDKPAVFLLGEVHLKKFGPPAITTHTARDLRMMTELIHMAEGVLSDGTPVEGYDA